MITKNKKNIKELIIAGDSWGCGAWSSAEGPIPADDYLTESFSKWFNVTNLSAGGESNSGIYRNLRSYFNTRTRTSIKDMTILVIQTEPSRDIFFGIDWFLKNPKCKIFEKVDFKEYCEINIDLYYYNLNALAIDYGVKIDLAGGCSDVDDAIIAKYSNLNVVCSSFYRLIDADHQSNITSATFQVEKLLTSFSKNNLAVVSAAQAKNKIQWDYRNNYFGWYPDNHPSKKGIDIWVNHMYTKLV